ncbi:hypothetical protein OROGR_031205 [Orobanche gracilis]
MIENDMRIHMFFTSEPYACEPSSLPKFPPSKEMDIKLRDEEARRQRGLASKPHGIDGNSRRPRGREKVIRAMPAPEANAELQTNLDNENSVKMQKPKAKVTNSLHIRMDPSDTLSTCLKPAAMHRSEHPILHSLPIFSIGNLHVLYGTLWLQGKKTKMTNLKGLLPGAS